MGAPPGKSNAKISNRATGVRYDTSVYGTPATVIIGRTRVAPKVIFAGNFKTAKTSSKKGGGKKGGSTPNYTGNFDWLLGYAPVSAIGSVWRNKNDFFPALVGSQTFAGSGSAFTITNVPSGHPFLGVISVLATIDVSVTFNDFGAPAPVTITEQQQLPLYHGTIGDNGNIAPGGFTPENYIPPSYVFNFGPPPSITLITSGHTPLVVPDATHPITVFYFYGKTAKSPLAQAKLEFEQELGDGNAFNFSGGSQFQVIYPEFAGISGENVDMGSGNAAPNDNFECQGFYGYSQTGDANPADAILDVILAGNPPVLPFVAQTTTVGVVVTTGRPASSGFNWNHGLGFGVKPTTVGMAQFPNVLADPPVPV